MPTTRTSNTTSTSGSGSRSNEATRRKSSAWKALSTLDSQLSKVGSLLREAIRAGDTSAQKELTSYLNALDQKSKDLAIERCLLGLGKKQFESYGAWVSRDYKLVACCGPIRTGKTWGGATAYAEYLRDEAPPDSSHICVTINQEISSANQQKMLWDLIPHHLFDTEWTGPRNGFSSDKPKIVLDKRTKDNPNGRNITVHFKTQTEYDNNIAAFEALTIETAWIDDVVSEDVYAAVRARCTLSDDGRILVTSIPSAEWFHERIYNAKPEDKVWFKLFEPFDNPLMTQEKWDLLERETPAHLRDVRIKGIPAMAGALVYTEFDRRHRSEGGHLFRREELPEDVAWYAGMDLGMDHPTVWLLVAVDQENRLWVVEEYVRRNLTCEEHAVNIKAQLGGRKLKMPTVIDPAAYQVTISNRVCPAMQLVQAGLPVTKALRTADYGERAMVFRIKEMFEHREIFVCEDCEELIRELCVWKYKRDQRNRPIATGSPFEDRNNDAVDSLRYLISMNPHYATSKIEVLAR